MNRKNVESLFKLIFILVIVVWAVWWGVHQIGYYRSDQIYADAEQLVMIDEPSDIEIEIDTTEVSVMEESVIEELPEETAQMEDIIEESDEPHVCNDAYSIWAAGFVDLSNMQAVNDDVIGWIRIRDTNISYPLLQGTDNEYYLKHIYNYEWSFTGSICLDYKNSASLTDFNSIIYGHNMNNDSMFGTLIEYKDINYWKTHPYVYVVNADAVYRYDIYAAYYAKKSDIIYGMKLQTKAKREEFIQFSLEKSMIDTGITPSANNHILTLSTCTGGDDENYRFIVQAVLNLSASTPLIKEEQDDIS